MPFVLTIDQRDSRHAEDAVADALVSLGASTGVGPTPLHVLARFERTVGDELQGAVGDGLSVVQCILTLMDLSQWHIGIGVGALPDPLPPSVRSARGPTFWAARSAVDQAKRHDTVIVVAAADGPGATDGPAATARAADATGTAQLLIDLVTRRSPSGREAVRLARSGLNQAEVADRLQVTRQAVGQRLAAARWPLEQRAVPVLARLLDRVDRHRAGSSDPERDAGDGKAGDGKAGDGALAMGGLAT